MIIDSCSYYEPALLDIESIIKRMDSVKIGKTVLTARLTEPPLYKKPAVLMAAQRFIMRKPLLRPIAKAVDDSFHRTKGQWSQWQRSFLKKQSVFKILFDPDNQSVFEAVKSRPGRFLGWIFINPLRDSCLEELEKWSKEPLAAGVSVHPFWHRYPVSRLDKVAERVRQLQLPLLMRLGFEQVKAVSRFCSRFPGLKIIFAHAGAPLYGDLWPLIKKRPDTCVILSSHHVDKGIIRAAVKALGPEKCMYGVDDPYGEPQAGLAIKGWIEKLPLSVSAKEEIFQGNFLNMIGRSFNSREAR